MNAAIGIDVISVGGCYWCKCPMYLPIELYNAARRRPDISFYCSYGHKQHFPEGETDAQKLRRERDRLTQRLAEKDDEIRHQREQREATERQLSATKGVVTRIRNRVGRGVCPCCNRSFENLHRHMATKHPDYASGEVTLPKGADG